MYSDSLPDSWLEISVEEINDRKSANIKPSDFPEEVFELYSVPTFPTGKPEYIYGSEIGSSKQMVEPGDVLLCKINPRINRVWWVSEKKEHRQIASSEWIVIRQPKLEPLFLVNYFSEYKFRDLLCSEVSGVGGSLTRAQPKKVATYPVRIAPLNEQTRIANKLDELLAQVDTIKARVDATPAILKRFRQSVLAAAVSGKLTEEWRGENGAVEWKELKLGDLCENSFYGPRFSKEDYVQGGIPTVRTTDMTSRGQIVITENTPTVNVPEEKIELFEAKKGDLLITRTGSIGVMAIYKLDQVAIPSAYLIRFRFTKEVLVEYVYTFLTSPIGQTFLGLGTTSVTQPNINAKVIKSIEISLPSIEEQKQIIQRIEQLFAFADQIEQRVKEAQARIDNLSQSILAKAFRGELVPQDPNDEPASVLLERIKREREEAAKLAKAAKKAGKKASKK